ncbi:asparagine synthetase B [Mucilaginibacter sp. SMC90]|uniref:asparagine synthetase B n=1 Tax=Mucilaginibacter sp. SMC90 TaxID=2929803 RepID=UPI001FB34086|nr:asparagine synthetase B [Mucilaginibacter sp. SMC90]UOE47750.1 asparagine synthetase B [Mucilaginibacter sp. SMC90]
MKKILFFSVVYLLLPFLARSSSILIAMDNTQKDHLKSYGLAYWVLKNKGEVDWLLNYRGGSFMTSYSKAAEDECKIRGISYEVLADAKVNEILKQISDPSVNMDVVKLEKLPKIAVYSPKDKGPVEDAVVLVLNYAEIPFDYVYDEEVLKGDLSKYDWLHMHHEDFTGQYGKENSKEKWYVDNQIKEETRARKLGFTKVSKMKLAVALTIRNFCTNGGFLFAMCSGTDSFDIALAAANTDICDVIYDGDPPDPNAQSKLDFTGTLAFQNFSVVTNPNTKQFSNIDLGAIRRVKQEDDFFTLFDFSAKWDVVASMLTQNHDNVIKAFNGLATAFDESKIKQGVTIMGETKKLNEARYLHGELGKGQWTFYAGHDPEDYQRHPGDPPTDLSLHPNSPGYRLILNNILFPAAKKKKQKT